MVLVAYYSLRSGPFMNRTVGITPLDFWTLNGEFVGDNNEKRSSMYTSQSKTDVVSQIKFL